VGRHATIAVAPVWAPGLRHGGISRIVPVKLLRRITAALAMAGIAAAGIRLKGSGGIPPQHGGWRPLELPPER
jgi:hypothetical protein